MANPFRDARRVRSAIGSGGGFVPTQPGDPNFSLSNTPDSQAQYPAAAAEKSLFDNQRYARNMLAEAQQRGVDVTQPEFSPLIEAAEQGFAERALTVGESMIRFLDGGRQAANLFLQDLLKNPEDEGRDVTLFDYADALWKGIEDEEQFKLETGLNPISGSQTLEMFGWEPVGNDETGFAAGMERVARGVAHFGLDVGIDPLTYVTFGLSGLGKNVAKATATKYMDDVVDEIIPLYRKGILDPEKLTSEYAQRVARMLDDDADNFIKNLDWANMSPKSRNNLKSWMRRNNIELPEGQTLEDMNDWGFLAVMQQNAAELGLRDRIHNEVVAPLLRRDFKAVNSLAQEDLPAYALGGIRIAVPFTKKSLEKGILVPGTQGLGRKVAGDPVRKLSARLREYSPAYNKLADNLDSALNAIDRDRALNKGLAKIARKDADGKVVRGSSIEGWQWHIARQAMDRLSNVEHKEFVMAKLHSLGSEVQAVGEKFGLDEEGMSKVWPEIMNRLEGRQVDTLLQQGSIVDSATGLAIPGRAELYQELNNKVDEVVDFLRVNFDAYHEQLALLNPAMKKRYIDGYVPHSVNKNIASIFGKMAGEGATVSRREIERMGRSQNKGHILFAQMVNAVTSGGRIESQLGAARNMDERAVGRLKALTLTDNGTVMFDSDFLKELFGATPRPAPGVLREAGEVAEDALDTRYLSVTEMNELLEPVVRDVAQRNNINLPKDWDGKVFNENPLEVASGYIDNLDDAISTWGMIEAMLTSGLAFNHATAPNVQGILQQVYNNALQNTEKVVLRSPRKGTRAARVLAGGAEAGAEGAQSERGAARAAVATVEPPSTSAAVYQEILDNPDEFVYHGTTGKPARRIREKGQTSGGFTTSRERAETYARERREGGVPEVLVYRKSDLYPFQLRALENAPELEGGVRELAEFGAEGVPGIKPVASYNVDEGFESLARGAEVPPATAAPTPTAGAAALGKTPENAIPAPQAMRQWDEIGDDDWVEVYHATNVETAERMSREGVREGEKPPHHLLNPEEIGPGLFVGGQPQRLSGYGTLAGSGGTESPFKIVAVKVRKRDLQIPNLETRNLGRQPTIPKLLSEPNVGAVVRGDIPAERFRVLSDADIAKHGEYDNLIKQRGRLGQEKFDLERNAELGLDYDANRLAEVTRQYDDLTRRANEALSTPTPSRVGAKTQELPTPKPKRVLKGFEEAAEGSGIQGVPLKALGDTRRVGLGTPDDAREIMSMLQGGKEAFRDLRQNPIAPIRAEDGARIVDDATRTGWTTETARNGASHEYRDTDGKFLGVLHVEKDKNGIITGMGFGTPRGELPTAKRLQVVRAMYSKIDELVESGELTLNPTNLRSILDNEYMTPQGADMMYGYLKAKIRQLDPQVREFLTGVPEEVGSFVDAYDGFMETFNDFFRRYGAYVDADGTLNTENVLIAGDEEFIEFFSGLKQAAKDLDDVHGFDTAVKLFRNMPDPLGLSVDEGFVNPGIFALGGPALEGLSLQTDIAKWLRQASRNSASIYTPEGIAALKMGTHSVLKWWKAMATISRPGFHIRNTIGGIWNNMIIGVGPDSYLKTRTHGLTLRNALRAGDDFDTALTKLPAVEREFWRAAWDNDVLNGFATSEFRGLTSAEKRNRMAWAKVWDVDDFALTRIGGRFMESIEDFLRMSAFRTWYDPADPGTAKVAAEMARLVHFDYMNLTPFETKVKEVVPFFVWTRRNIPLQLQQYMENPRMVQRYTHMMDALNDMWADDEGGGMPIGEHYSAFAAKTGWTVNEGTPFWARAIIDPDLPIRDLVELPRPNVGELFQFALDRLGPHISTIVNLNEQREFGDVNAPAGMNAVLQSLAAVGLYDRTMQGDVRVPYHWRTLQETLVPFSRDIINPLTGGSADPTQRARAGITRDDGFLEAGAKTLGATVLSAMGIRGSTPSDTRSTAYRTDQELQALVKKLRLEGQLPAAESPTNASDPFGLRTGRRR